MDYGGGGGQRVCWPLPLLKLLGGPGSPGPPSSYIYAHMCYETISHRLHVFESADFTRGIFIVLRNSELCPESAFFASRNWQVGTSDFHICCFCSFCITSMKKKIVGCAV